MPCLAADELRQFSGKLLVAGGADASEATTVASSLVGANLRGHDSHGVMRLPFYLDRVASGHIKTGQSLEVLRETPAMLTCDGGWGFGQVLARDLVGRLITRAQTAGIACGALRRSAHIGRLGEYSELAAESGMAAIVCANTHGTAQRVAPVGGKRPRLGTNPISIGMPGGQGGPFVLDFGTSATAEGKVRVKKIAGAEVPEGWVLDPHGRPTTDPNQLYGDPPGTILPMGGDQAYKGFGLALMIEMLCGVLSEGDCVQSPPPPVPLGNCAMFIVISIERFGSAEHAAKEIAGMEAYVRGVPLIDGVERVILPGDPERETLATRSVSGIPIDEGNWQALVERAGSLGVELPEVDNGSM
ncbi:MAG: Ldh family oxidoreductase [Planctomycetaceae bacterium]